MKKHLLLIAVLLTIGCSKDSDTPSQTQKNLSGFTATLIPFEFGEPNPSEKRTWESEKYDSEGNVIKRRFYLNPDILSSVSILRLEESTYEDGKLIERKESSTFQRRNVYHYNNDLLSRIDIYNQDGLIEKNEFKYSGNETTPNQMIDSRSPFSKIFKIHSYTYDSNGNKIEDIIHYPSSDDGDGILYWKYDS